MGKTFYISDLAFGRSPASCEDRVAIEKWNKAVDIGDEVWILGNMSWYNAEKTIAIFNKLNGIKHLCIGNRDKPLLENKNVRDLFVEIVDYKEIMLSKKIGLVLCHYPISCYNNHNQGWYHFYGHVCATEWVMIQQFQQHMKHLSIYGKDSNMYNVMSKVSYMDDTPKTFGEIVHLASKYDIW